MNEAHGGSLGPDDRRARATTRPGAAARWLLVSLARAARRAPLTTVAVLVLWAAGIASGSVVEGPSPGLRTVVGAGLGPARAGHWWFPLTAPLWCSGLLAYLATTALLITLLAVAEHRLGARRTAAVAIVVQLGGSAAGTALVAALAQDGGRWAGQLDASVAVGPGPVLVGTALAATATLPALWRRRLRVGLLVVLVMLALYSGLLADVLRLCTGLVGYGVGLVWLRRPGGRGEGSPGTGSDGIGVVRASRVETRVLVALLVAASAVGPLIAAIAQTRIGPLSVLRFVFASPPPDPVMVAQLCADPAAARVCAHLTARLRLSGIAPAALSILPVLLALAVAEGLRRGRRAAWWAGVVLHVALTALGIFLAADTVASPPEQRVVLGDSVHLHAWLALALPALQPLLVAAMLLLARPAFAVHAAAGTHRRWGLRIAATAAAVAVLYVAVSLLAATQYDRPPGLGDLLADLPLRLLPPGYLGENVPAFLPVGPVAAALYDGVGIVFWTVVLLAALATFARTPPRPQTSDLSRVRALLARTGGSSMAHQASWPGQSYAFTPTDPRGPTGDGAGVAYRVIGGVALSTGEPVGDPVYREQAVRGFAALCHRHGWTPCLYNVGTPVADIAQDMGWSVVQVAEETVLPLPGLAFTGKKWQDVRTALNQAEAAGITAEWVTYRDAPRVLTDQIRAISQDWVAAQALPEMGFTLGGLDELTDTQVRLMLAVDADRTVHGVTSWLPVRRDGEIIGWTLDVMRRRRGGFRPVMEFLIASAARHAHHHGAEFLSLSGAPLARRDRGIPPGRLQRLLDVTGRALEPVYGFGSLLAFKAKFQPEYRPLHLAYPDPAALPAIANAIARAYLPDLTARQAGRLARRVLAR